jgi:hypothetical protein
MNKWLTWIMNLGNLAKILPLVFAIVGCIAWYNSHIIKKYNEKNNNEKLSRNVTIVLTRVDSLYTVIDKMNIEQVSLKEDVIEKLENLEGTVMIIKNQLGKYIIKTATKEDILDWMNAFEKKNNRQNDGSTSLILCR